MEKRLGRPSQYHKLNRNHLRKLCEAGWTDERISDFFGITRRCLAKWKARYPEFAEKMLEWKTDADKRVERSMFESAMGYDVLEEKIFVHVGKVKETKPDGSVIEYDKPHIIRVPTYKHISKNVTAGIFWLTNRMYGDWKRTRQEAGTDPLSAKIMDLLKKNGNGNGNGHGHEEGNRLPADPQAQTVETTVVIQRKTGVQVVE